jgi:hypothetical protein
LVILVGVIWLLLRRSPAEPSALAVVDKPAPVPPSGAPMVPAPAPVPPAPVLRSLTVTGPDSLTLKPGQATDYAIRVTRQGFEGPIQIAWKDLPPTISAHSVRIPADSNTAEVHLRVTARPDAPAQEVDVRLLASVPGTAGDFTTTKLLRISVTGQSQGDDQLLTTVTRDWAGYRGYSGWSGAQQWLMVMSNSTDKDLRGFPSKSVVVHPGPKSDHCAAIAWKSPKTGTISVTGRVSDVDTTSGDGVAWAIDLVTSDGTRELSAGNLANGQAMRMEQGRGAEALAMIQVKKSDRIRICVLPKQDNLGDSTRIELTIAMAGGPTWDLAKDVVEDLIQSNPHGDREGRADIWHFLDHNDTNSQRPPIDPFRPGTEPTTPAPMPEPVTVKKKLPVPDTDAQAAAEKLIHELFKADFQKPKTTDMMTLAGKLTQQAFDSKDDDAARYVLLREARDLASRAGEPRYAFRMVDEMARWYIVDAFEQKNAVLAVATKTASPKVLADAALLLGEEAIASDRYDVAVSLLATASTAARRANSAALVNRVEARERAAKEMQKEFTAVQSAEETLKAEPTNPAANLTKGKFLCLLKGEWDKGLPFLAAGGEDRLAVAAGKDTGGPTEAEAQAEVAEAWWDLAEAEKGPAKTQLLRRAHHWYKQAHSDLKGLAQTKAEKRLAVLNPLFPETALKSDGTGLLAELYTGRDFDRKIKTRVDPRIDWLWGDGTPDPDLGYDDFSIRWSGWIKIPVTGRYRFQTETDDGVRLYIDGKKVVDRWTQGQHYYSHSLILAEGLHSIRMEYFEQNFWAFACLNWTRPGATAPQVVPHEVLFHDKSVALRSTGRILRPKGTGLTAEYFRGREFETKVRTRVDPMLNFHLGFSAVPDESVPHTDFSVRWKGFIKVPKTGTYRFVAIHDDGFRLWIDDKSVMDFWQFPSRRSEVSIDLTEGVHALRAEYYQALNSAQLSLHWELRGTFREMIVPAEVFFTDRAAAELAEK